MLRKPVKSRLEAWAPSLLLYKGQGLGFRVWDLGFFSAPWKESFVRTLEAAKTHSGRGGQAQPVRCGDHLTLDSKGVLVHVSFLKERCEGEP